MNKVAIITGAGTGVGKATAVKLSDAGYSVILIGRRKEKLEETKTVCNDQALVLPMDVSNEVDVKKCFEMIKKNFSRIDLLFNNAGTFLSSKTIDEINFNEWKEVIEVNINGMFLFTKYAFSLMRSQSPMGGRIIVCSQIDIGNADTPMTEGIKKGIIQADGSIKKEPTFDPEHIADAVLHLVGLPLDTNILNMTIMASKMPFIGRG